MWNDIVDICCCGNTPVPASPGEANCYLKIKISIEHVFSVLALFWVRHDALKNTVLALKVPPQLAYRPVARWQDSPKGRGWRAGGHGAFQAEGTAWAKAQGTEAWPLRELPVLAFGGIRCEVGSLKDEGQPPGRKVFDVCRAFGWEVASFFSPAPQSLPVL